ncbi:MAG: DUF1501 domain-containing protein, partial [Planctomycetales bacterium]|nr:DUF1501 domain-containing protein [Planctomycetales bacterium]
MNRRTWLSRTGSGLGWCALAGMTTTAARAEQAQAVDHEATAGPLTARTPHFEPRAKRVIMLFMQGGPSQLDMFDPKPALADASINNGRRGAQLMASPWKFRSCGQSGLPISELLPNLGTHADS